MKHILFIVILVLAGVPAVMAQPLTASYPGYTVSLYGMPQDDPDATFFPLVTGRLDTLTREQRNVRFGILFRGAPGSPAEALTFTFIDGATGATIRDMSYAAYAGSGAEGIRPIAERSARTDSSRTDAFTITGPLGSFVAVRTIARVSDSTMPGGARMFLDWSIESRSERQIRVVMSGRVEGIATARGNALSFSPDASFRTYRPQIGVVGPAGGQADVVPASQASPGSITLTGPSVRVPSNRPTSVFRVSVFGTTVGIAEYVPQQSANLTSRINGASPSPAMVTRTFVDKPSALPGDTVTYRILFHNIGTGPATGVVLTNPMPERVTYLDGSATGEDAEIAVRSSEPEPPQASVAEAITWTFMSNILPGGERWASFKVIVQ